jgi:hypothetical protein
MVQALRTSLRHGGLRQGGLQPGLGGDSIFATSSLDLNFAKHKNLGTIVDATTGANLVDFTRASSGTYVDSEGVIRTATTNLLLRSEEFDNASWTKTDTSISSDSIAAPTGLQTGDTYTEGASGSPGIFQVVTSLTASTVYTGSIYIKRGNNDWYRLLFVDNTAFANGARAWINLATGAFSTVENIGTGTGVASSITPLANGWYRVSLSTAMGGANTAFRFQVNSAASNGSAYTGDGTCGIYLWGAQLEQSTTVGEYIPTTSTINSAPRFDHNPTTGESLGLLVEEQRTNLLLRSEEFDGAGWTASEATITANQIVAPNGLNNCRSLYD